MNFGKILNNILIAKTNLENRKILISFGEFVLENDFKIMSKKPKTKKAKAKIMHHEY